ncbi:glutathione S-transferase family protein [Prosthecomicrobium sp. N25]|uniref:glutathione S-transferase family protein n=1 Tax=Prosthecomicrobium sp. N25 TaxID=3129254 RepID=UPI0030771FC3
MIKLYGIPRSRGFRNIWALEEAGVAYEQVPVGFDGGEMSVSAPWFARINPAKRVPVLEDDGLVVTESLAINLYLAKTYGPAIYPSDPKAEAKVLQWSFFAATELERPIGRYNYNTFVYAPEKRSAEAAAAALAEATPRLQLLDLALGASPYLVGDAFTIADLNVASVLYGVWFNGFDFSSTPNVAAWLERCLERPAALKARKLREG